MHIMILKAQNGTSEGYQAMKDLIKRQVINLNWAGIGVKILSLSFILPYTAFCFGIKWSHYWYCVHDLPQSETKFRRLFGSSLYKKICCS